MDRRKYVGVRQSSVKFADSLGWLEIEAQRQFKTDQLDEKKINLIYQKES
jgi:hypothetical protein